MKLIKRILDSLKKEKEHKDSHLHFYDEESQKIEFSNLSIYEYLKSEVGDELDLFALNYFDNRITYRELFRKINLIAKALKYIGISKNDVVSICVPNTPEAIEIFYATSKIGAVAEMIHPLSSEVEVKKYLEESDSKVLFLYDENYKKYENLINELSIKVVLLGVSESMPKKMKLAYKALNCLKKNSQLEYSCKLLSWQTFINSGYLYHKKIEEKTSSKNLAVILHSGGTSGTPKGIMISNYSFNAMARQGAINVINVEPKDKILTVLPIFHGFGLGVCVHCPLCLKVEVILMPIFELKTYKKLIKKWKPNVLAGVPTMWEAMLNSSKFKRIDLSCLKYVISGGDTLSLKTEKRMNEFLALNHASIKITKGYGLSESLAAVVYTFDEVNSLGALGIPMIGNEISICIPNTTIDIGKEMEGEICIFGPTLMMGYLNNKKETKNVLKLHDDGKIWLHTGDMGKIDKDGILYFTGRLKRMIVSSGFNIYPSRIEEIILSHDSVLECAVIGIPHPYKMQVPKAFVVLKEDYTPNVILKAELRLLVKNNLAEYVGLKEIEFVKEIPKTIYKKIDFKKLEEEEKSKR